jgi:hypothetical protein
VGDFGSSVYDYDGQSTVSKVNWSTYPGNGHSQVRRSKTIHRIGPSRETPSAQRRLFGYFANETAKIGAMRAQKE